MAQKEKQPLQPSGELLFLFFWANFGCGRAEPAFDVLCRAAFFTTSL
jgi:hypothetical protein